MNNFTAINTRQVETFQDALDLNERIVGRKFYEGYENVQRTTESSHDRGNFSDWRVSTEGDIYYIYTCPDSLRILHKLSMHTCIDNGGFDRAIIDDTGIVVHRKNWGNTPQNRKIMADKGFIITKLD